ncbi:MAG: NAD(P)/FAD-dependent oxidoreductase [Acidobacteria bacterium]|nr:MAG: NAD(P)/FAD-dependent oxidoreductase [Acidobacteriota bacterium]REK03732.1 MAG: NAD(P)/FAD-dependent oxidoreductase [Acidobacteriota bacterium]
MTDPIHHHVIVLGAGVSGIYQIHRLVELGLDAIVLEADEDLGGTWYRNRYPGCRFDSESYTYGYSFSREVLDEWHWKERFSSQPENLRYLNFVADKFDLRRHMRFDSRVEAMRWDDDLRLWTLDVAGGRRYTARFVISAIGVLSTPTLPRYQGMEEFEGDAFHTYWWPKQEVPLEGRRVGVIGTGATGIQVIAEIASQVDQLFVFQRRPNWSTPLNNSPISEQEMAEIRARYDEIFATCAISNGGFEHLPDRRGFWNVTPEQRRALWDELYATPGFAILARNFPEIYLDEEANREISEYVAERIRGRVHDPEIAEKLIPKDHGFGTQRLPLETRYFEAYNRGNVHLVDLSETPIERITRSGIQTTAAHHDLDLIVYATGFDAITGAWDRIDIHGAGGAVLAEKWRDGPSTFFGLMTRRFPNLLMVAGPQSVSGSTNFPRAIEGGVDWVTRFLEHAIEHGVTRFEAHAEAEREWTEEVVRRHEKLLARRSRGWFTGYNSNVAGHGEGSVRYVAYFGGAPKYAELIRLEAESGYPGVDLE